MQKSYRIHRSAEERDSLTALTTSSKPISAKKVIKARALLLLADESDSGPSLRDVEIMKATGMKPATLVRLRQRVGEVGPIAALDRRPQTRPSREKIVDGEVEAILTQIACSEAPDGRSRWTLRLIADRLVELEIVDSISYETVRAAVNSAGSRRCLALETKKCYRSWVARYARFAGDEREVMREETATRFLTSAVEDKDCAY